jgi:hypothetical protein
MRFFKVWFEFINLIVIIINVYSENTFSDLFQILYFLRTYSKPELECLKPMILQLNCVAVGLRISVTEEHIADEAKSDDIELRVQW